MTLVCSAAKGIHEPEMYWGKCRIWMNWQVDNRKPHGPRTEHQTHTRDQIRPGNKVKTFAGPSFLYLSSRVSFRSAPHPRCAAGMPTDLGGKCKRSTAMPGSLPAWFPRMTNAARPSFAMFSRWSGARQVHERATKWSESRKDRALPAWFPRT